MATIFNIRDLEKGTKATIEFTFQNQSFSFESEIIEIIDRGALVRPIMINNKVLNLSKQSVPTNITFYPKKAKPIIWKKCAPRLAKTGAGHQFYLIENASGGVELNRREFYRQPISLDGNVFFGSSHSAWTVAVRDISMTGVSFVTAKSCFTIPMNDAVGTEVKIVFDDIRMNHHFSLLAHVAHVESIDDKVIFGCKFAAPHKELTRYLNLKAKDEKANHLDKASALRVREALALETSVRTNVV